MPANRPAGKREDGAAEEEEAKLELTDESEEVWVKEISTKKESALQPKAAVAQGKASLRTDNAADSLVQAFSAGGDNDPASSRAGGQKAGSRTALSPGQATTVRAAHDTAREPGMLSGPGSQAILIRNASKRSLEEAKLPAERKLPPWFRDYLDDSGEVCCQLDVDAECMHPAAQDTLPCRCETTAWHPLPFAQPSSTGTA